MHDALPLLALSQPVEIVTINPSSAAESDDDAEHLSAHLANHEIEIQANVIRIRAEKEPTALGNISKRLVMIFWSWEGIRTRCGWNSSSVERPNRCRCRRKYLSLFPTRVG